ncbi:putative transposase [Gottschalkia purinilytica]|uniref:Putative transposase n=2 Tax=Gottschalkia purinilytica TaxID=1503 RepID=A0A0L0W5Z3_GOTPU|nr:IS3 family transposase [Gottschalkia purinilytica]KNF06948.1 putative transposase [Gottschalkia purinilytica]
MVVNSLRHEYKLSILLDIAKLKRPTFYYHLSRLSLKDKYDEVKLKIKEIYHNSKGRYGYRRITMTLRNSGIVINHKTVQKLMKELGLKCQVRIKKYKSYRGEVGRIAPNILQRNFEATKPNEKWVTDITEFSLFGEKLYLSPILDLFNGEIVSYCIANRPHFGQVMDMLDKAFEKHDNLEGLIMHSDQGWQYQHKTYQSRLKQNSILQSMSRKGNCLDNAVMENFFGLLKSELLYLQEFKSLEHFKEELEKYIKWYNEYRIKSKLKGLSPIEYRKQSLLVA